ncbi:hypothetical protein Tco_0255153 [Tanacetum coccineum]
MQTQTSNALHNAIIETGGKDRHLMLAPGNYVQWKSRIKRYIDTKLNNELIHYCLQNPPYKFKWAEKTIPFTEGGSETTTEGYMENYKNVLQDIRNQLDVKAEAVQIILTGIDNDIYSTVDACPNTCEMWKAIERLKQGESINVQDLETNLYWEFGKFTSQDGKTLESYYSRFVTLVKQSQELKTVSYHKLYDILKQHQNKVNLIRAERLAPATRNRGKAIVNSPPPTYDQEPAMVTQDDDMSKEKEIDKLMDLIPLSFKKIYKPINNNLRTSSNISRANQDNTPRINRGTGKHLEQPESVNDTCSDKQGDTNITTDSLDMSNNGEESDQDDDDLAKERSKEVFKTRKDKEIEKVIALENKVKVLDNIVYKTCQSVQTMNMLNRNCKVSFVKPEFLKKAQRVNPLLYDIGCYNDNLALMLAPESDEMIRLAKESRSKLSDLIKPFDYKNLNKLYDLFVPQREKSVKQRYFQKGVITTTSVSKPQLKRNPLEDGVLHNNSQGKKQEVEDHRRNFNFSNNKTSVTACNDSLNVKTSNVMFVCVSYGKCVLYDNHDFCVLHYINDVNSRTKQLIVVPISTREPKRNVNQSIATPLKQTVASDSTNQKPRNTTRKQYEHVSKTCRWWYSKITPPGYKCKPKSSTVNVKPNVSMPLGTKSRTTNILESMTLKGSTLSNTPLSSNLFASHRDNSVLSTLSAQST